MLRTSEKLITEAFVGNTTDGSVILSNCDFTSVRTKFAHFGALPREIRCFFSRFFSSKKGLYKYLSDECQKSILLKTERNDLR